VLGTCLLGAGAGCGGGSDEPPPPAHSSSFFPVRGTTDGGGAADLQWVYRLDDGAAVPFAPAPGSNIRYNDETMRISGTIVTTSLSGTLESDDGAGVMGVTSAVTTDHLSSDSPATVLAREVDGRSSLTASGSRIMSRVMVMYTFGTMPEPTFFDRSDLDTLAVGFSESADLTATASVTVSSGTQAMGGTETVSLSLAWTLQAIVPSFTVRGQDYANVVQVQERSSATESTSGAISETSSKAWLAKGIGLIRAETTTTQATGVQNDTTELVSTNLVAP
jgi:hypothetical protein